MNSITRSSRMIYTLGLSYGYHDSSATLLCDEAIVAACEEERFTRKKHERDFPINSIKYSLASANIRIEELDLIVYYEDPVLKFKRQSLSCIRGLMEKDFSNIRNLSNSLRYNDFTSRDIANRLSDTFDLSVRDRAKIAKKIVFSQHHLSHAASAFYPSPFAEGAVLCIDGVGEMETTTAWYGQGNSLKRLWSVEYPHSLGLLYSTFTSYCGFKVNSGEYKLMGLAPYGKPNYAQAIEENFIEYLTDGSFRINQKYFDYDISNSHMFSNEFIRFFGMAPRTNESEISEFYKDVASSVQLVCEKLVLRLAEQISVNTGSQNLCLAGGVALNCVANGRLKRKGIFRNIWVQPAAGDAGGSLGAAYAGYYLHLKGARKSDGNKDKMRGCLLGPQYEIDKLEHQLSNMGVEYTIFDEQDLYSEVARLLAEANVIGWFNGKMEYGPRALGSRSILADPRIESMQKDLNMKIKFREGFRPFAPAVLEGYQDKVFEQCDTSPYMLFTYAVRDTIINEKTGCEMNLPAIKHVDNSARVQTVSEDGSIAFYRLLLEFYRQTGCPVLINTSFNLRGEPIVCTPQDAFNSFAHSHIDVLVVNSLLIKKIGQNEDIFSVFKKGAVDLD